MKDFITVEEVIDAFEMTAWQRFLFWSVNIPRYLLGLDLVVYRCMIGYKVDESFVRATIQLGDKDD